VREVIDTEIRKGRVRVRVSGASICRILDAHPIYKNIYSTKEITNYLSRSKEKVTNIPARMSLIDLQNYCGANSILPGVLEPDKPYVVSSC